VLSAPFRWRVAAVSAPNRSVSRYDMCAMWLRDCRRCPRMRKAMSDGAADLLTATTVPRISGRDCQDERMTECAKDASMSDDFEAQRLCANSAVISTDLEGCGGVRRKECAKECGSVRHMAVCSAKLAKECGR
jgi:hypothetical protein